MPEPAQYVVPPIPNNAYKDVKMSIIIYISCKDTKKSMKVNGLIKKMRPLNNDLVAVHDFRPVPIIHVMTVQRYEKSA
jgi:hypothetical protein